MDESNRHARSPRDVRPRDASEGRSERTERAQGAASPHEVSGARRHPPRRAGPRPTHRISRPRRRTLGELQPLVREGRFRIARHAVRHAAAEGFTERDIVGTMLHGRELMRYVDDERLLVLGWVALSPRVRIPLHVVMEYSTPRWVDVVTAYLPEEPHRVMSRTRLAQHLRYDRASVEVAWVGAHEIDVA